MLNLCFALWCLVGSAPENQVNPPLTTLFIGHEFLYPDTFNENGMMIEQYRAFGGIVQSPDGLTATGGYFPLQVGLGRVGVEGGVTLSSGPLPTGGTHFNWVARLKVRIVKHLSLEWWHFSNGGLGNNPSLDMMGIGVRF